MIRENLKVLSLGITVVALVEGIIYSLKIHRALFVCDLLMLSYVIGAIIQTIREYFE